MVETLGFALIAVLALFIAWPLLGGPRGDSGTEAGEELAHLLERRDILYREIADLDFDYHVGKIDGTDYRSQRQFYLDEASALLQRLDALGEYAPRETLPKLSLEETLEAEIQRIRRNRAQS